MRRFKGTIYLEPRSEYDAALKDEENIIYCFDLLIDILMKSLNVDYNQAVDFYCFNIEPLTYEGLAVEDNGYYEEI